MYSCDVTTNLPPKSSQDFLCPYKYYKAPFLSISFFISPCDLFLQSSHYMKNWGSKGGKKLHAITAPSKSVTNTIVILAINIFVRREKPGMKSFSLDLLSSVKVCRVKWKKSKKDIIKKWWWHINHNQMPKPLYH